MNKLTQQDRFIQVDTPLGKDALVLTSFTGREEISQPFQYKLEMVSTKDSLDAARILGKPVSVKIAMEDGSFEYQHGVAWRFVAGKQDSYEEPVRHYWAEIVPEFKVLSLNANCRVFQEKTAPQVIEQVLKDAGHTDYQLKLGRQYAKLDYCVQWRESDYDFASRLMEENGIHYYFKHEAKKHTLVISDQARNYGVCSQDKAKYYGAFDSQMEYRIDRWDHQYALVSDQVALSDYNYEAPTDQMAVKEKAKTKSSAKKQEVFDYPGGYAKLGDGKPVAVARIEAIEAGYDTVSGESNLPGLSVGHKFKIVEHPVDSERNKSYALLSIEQSAREPSLLPADDDSGEIYRNSFVCLPSKVNFRPPRRTPKPIVAGPLPAIVVGPKGSKIYPDKFGRVKVQFFWDREGKFDDKSSAWLRVAQGWAGKQWGAFFTPRVGQEVMVSFLDGDPDRPIVTGSVYNADNMPPYKQPEQKTQSGVKTQTLKGKAKDYNELRFDDLDGKEHVYFHAQRDFVRVVENVDRLEIGFDTSEVSQGESLLEVSGDKEKGDQIVRILNNRTVDIDKGSDKLNVLGKDRLVTISKGNLKVAIKQGFQETTAQKHILFKVGGNSIKIDQKGIAIKGLEVKIDGTTKVSVKAGLSLKAESAMTDVVGSGMVAIKGGIVKLN